MKLIILFLSAICIAMMFFIAYYSDPWRAAIALYFVALLAALLIYAYIPAWRRRVAVAMIIGFILPAVLMFIPILWITYNNGDLPITGIMGGIIGSMMAFGARDRVKNRNRGIPSLPGDEHKSDEELASNADTKINIPWRKRNIFNRNS